MKLACQLLVACWLSFIAGATCASLTRHRAPPEIRTMPVTHSNLDDVFTYHPATPEQQALYVAIREKAKELVELMLGAGVPVCADQSAAIRHVREGVMTVNAAIATGGAV